MLIEGALNQLVKNIIGLLEVYFYLLYISTRVTLERAQVYLNATALIGISITRIDTKIIITRSIALSALKYYNKQYNYTIKVSVRGSYKAGITTIALEVYKQRLQSYIIRQ